MTMTDDVVKEFGELLTSAEIQRLRPTNLLTVRSRKQNALCDMALQSLRPPADTAAQQPDVDLAQAQNERPTDTEDCGALRMREAAAKVARKFSEPNPWPTVYEAIANAIMALPLAKNTQSIEVGVPLSEHMDDHSADGLMRWLLNQHARHHEIEDKLAASMLARFGMTLAKIYNGTSQRAGLPRLALHEINIAVFEALFPNLRATDSGDGQDAPITPKPNNSTPEIAALVERINGFYAKATKLPWKSIASPVQPKEYRCLMFSTKRDEMYGTSALLPPDADFIAALVNAWPQIAAALSAQPDAQSVRAGTIEAMTDAQIIVAIRDAGASEKEWKALTFDSGPYGIATPTVFTDRLVTILRALPAAPLSERTEER